MAKAASSDKLRAAFEKHHDETEGQIERLEQVFELLGKPPRGKKCDAIEGILDEGKEIMEEYEEEPALDAGRLAAAQAVEHYEISRYGTLKSWAAKLGMKDAVKLLDQTLAEEKKTDDALTKLADSEVKRGSASSIIEACGVPAFGAPQHSCGNSITCIRQQNFSSSAPRVNLRDGAPFRRTTDRPRRPGGGSPPSKWLRSLKRWEPSCAIDCSFRLVRPTPPAPQF
jgi:ferritin-like metal-binding protein YciE